MDSIAIIGAGLAGLAAARNLQLAGREVTVYEKNQGPGGRVSSGEESWGRFDQGAQYFTARDPRFIAQLETWRHQGKVALWPFQPKYWRDGQLENSQDREQRWVGLPSMHTLAVDLAQDIPIRNQTRIAALSREQGQWWLFDAKGQQFGPYAGLILALPAPQALALVPLVSPLRQRLQSVQMKPCWSLALGFQEALQGPALSAEDQAGIFCQHPVLRWISRDSRKPERDTSMDTWVLHCQPDWSARHWDVSSVELVRHAQQALAQILGIALPAPKHSHCHRWRYAQNQAAPVAAPSLPHPGKVGILPVSATQQAPMDDLWRLAACGDWQYGGRVEGAYLSGIEIASHALQRWP